MSERIRPFSLFVFFFGWWGSAEWTDHLAVAIVSHAVVINAQPGRLSEAHALLA